MNKVLIIDNYDSFTYNLVHAVEEILGNAVTVRKNDQLVLEEIAAYDYLILSPGPGLPDEAGLLKDIIRMYRTKKKILGVCLGLQAIAEVYGCQLKNLNQVFHGIQSEIKITERSSPLYVDLPDTIVVGRYHSWVIAEPLLGPELVVTSRTATGHIMSIEDRDNPVYAVQYHPESIMTPAGNKILSNFLSL